MQSIVHLVISVLLCSGVPATASISSPIAFQPALSSVKRSTYARRQANHPTIHTRTQSDRPVFGTNLRAIEPSSVQAGFTSTMLSYEETMLQQPISLQDASIEQLSPTTTLIVFIIGIIPFLWATYEFWRRIAFGEPFGTGSDSVIIPSPDQVFIGEDDNPNSSRGRRTLDKGALTVAYVLFAVAASTVIVAVASVVMGPKPDL
ncbi:hypothetical protein HJC23_003731 [Cyclotella cryptica]|uniref:Uncharacterized protein n=1 Tax=Cyclotella cryptica TaxID=29204 RepID=A0ABD3QU39_9STRA|eukprot:CCRYP_002134-RA/>CCRYP_002134-RA protein AED:0.37 eAED:0.37 QI:0/-1/0/1/-1/1/1/0/203